MRPELNVSMNPINFPTFFNLVQNLFVSLYFHTLVSNKPALQRTPIIILYTTGYGLDDQGFGVRVPV
jgi:hypothetical protein